MLRRQVTALPSLAHRASWLVADQSRLLPAAAQAAQLRGFADAPPPLPSPPSPTPYVYVAPFSSAVRKVKRLSLFSCACAVAAGPLIMGLDPSSTLTAKVSIAGTLTSFGLFTTGLLHWFTSPYVHRLVHKPDEEAVEVTTLDVLGRPRSAAVPLAAVHEADSVHPLSSFAAGGKIYYLDRDHFADKSLLERLAPSPPAATPE